MLFPTPIRTLISHLPSRPPMWIACQVLNTVAKPTQHPDVWQPLQDKFFCIHVIDFNLKAYLSLTPKGFIACPAPAHSDLCFSASAADFYRLACRQEDADTLFFSRRLWIEGDTELGLIAKNTFDSLDLSHLANAIKSPLSGLTWLKQQLKTSAPAPSL